MNAIGGAIRLLPSGRYQADRSEADGSRLRRNFPTLEAAKAWLLDLHLVRQSQAAPLTALEAIQYREAVAALPPGGTLLEAARLLAERRRAAPLMGTTLVDVYARHLVERQTANLRARSVNAIRYALSPLVTDFGPRVMSAIQRDELARWVAARGGSPASRAARSSRSR